MGLGNSKEDLAIKASLMAAKQELEKKTGKGGSNKSNRGKADQDEILKRIKKKKKQAEEINYDIFKLKRAKNYPPGLDAKAVLEVVKQKLWEDPKDISLINIAIASYIQLKDYKKADFECKKALNVNPNDKDTLYNKADLSFRSGNLSQALENAATLAKVADDIDAYYIMSKVLFLQNAKKELTAILSNALKKDTESRRVHANFALLSLITSNFGKAEEELDRLIEEDVKNIGARLAQGYINLVNGEYEKYNNQMAVANNLVDKENPENPYYPCYYVNEAYKLSLNGDKEQARKHLEKAISANKNCICARTDLVRLLTDEKNFNDVYAEVKEALEIDSHFIPVLGEILRLSYYGKREDEVNKMLIGILKLDSDIKLKIYGKEAIIARVKLADIAKGFSVKIAAILNEKYKDLDPDFTIESFGPMVAYKLFRDIELCDIKNRKK